ncbi:Mov34/MPN/PAD-1 family protein [Trichothermofontia sp.]
MLHLTLTQRQAIFHHAEKTYDEECCGLLLGKYRLEVKTNRLHQYVRQVIPVANQWHADIAAELSELAAPSPDSLTKSRRYWIDPQDLLIAQRRARDLGLAIIGIYHSHPDHPAIPSESDRVCAWAGYSYVIVSVVAGTAQDLRSWRLDEQCQFQPEAIGYEAAIADIS